MTRVYLGIGSNVGERISFIEKALTEIGKLENTIVTKISSVYETEPWGNIKQDDYLNCCAEIETGLDASHLLTLLKGIENKLGRSGNRKWAEREIDIDILFYGNEVILNENMHVPHSQISNRKFVLIPLAEIAPDYIHPVSKKTIDELAKETKDELGVIRYDMVKD